MISETTADEVEAALPRVARRHAPEAAGLHRRHPRRRRLAHIVDGRVPHSLLLELFTDAGIGTKIAAGGMITVERSTATPR